MSVDWNQVRSSSLGRVGGHTVIESISGSTNFKAHLGHKAHFVALPHTGQNKSSEIYKNEENKKRDIGRRWRICALCAKCAWPWV